MLQAAEDLEFERAASLRDKLLHLREHVGEHVAESGEKYNAKGSGRKGRGAKSGTRIPVPKNAKGTPSKPDALAREKREGP